jgi:hypothetical protein
LSPPEVAAGNKANGGGVVRGIDAGNAVSGVSDAVGVGAGDASSVAVGAGKASFVAKTNSSIAQEWFAFLGTHVNAPMISLNSRLYSLPEYEAG